MFEINYVDEKGIETSNFTKRVVFIDNVVVASNSDFGFIDISMIEKKLELFGDELFKISKIWSIFVELVTKLTK